MLERCAEQAERSHLDRRSVVRPGIRQFLHLVLKCFWLKAVGTSVFTSVFFIAYIHLLRYPAGHVLVMPRIVLDNWIGFHSWALIPYLSLWLYVSLPAILMAKWRDIVDYGWRMALMCGTGLIIFYLWPTAVPVPDIDWNLYPEVAFLKGVDAAGNACPSLHVATAVYSAVWLHAMFAAWKGCRWLRYCNLLWCVLIVYSTVATRQHVVLDALAGTAMAFVFAWLFLFTPGRVRALSLED